MKKLTTWSRATARMTIVFALGMGAGIAPPFVAGAQEKPAAASEKDSLPTPAQITKTLDDLYRSESSHATMTMTIVNDRGTRKLTLEQWSKGQDDALVVIRKPAREAGTATLMTADGLWNYAPRADRLIRVPTGLLSDSWMGSHFSNDDLVRETSLADDYESNVSWDELDGAKMVLITLKPRPNAPVVYTEIRYWVRPGDFVPRRADYYDDGKLMRRMEFTSIKEVGGKPIPHRMELIPMNKKGEKTVMEYESLEFDIDVDADLFSKRGLRRAAKR